MFYLINNLLWQLVQGLSVSRLNEMNTPDVKPKAIQRFIISIVSAMLPELQPMSKCHVKML